MQKTAVRQPNCASKHCKNATAKMQHKQTNLSNCARYPKTAFHQTLMRHCGPKTQLSFCEFKVGSLPVYTPYAAFFTRKQLAHQNHFRFLCCVFAWHMLSTNTALKLTKQEFLTDHWCQSARPAVRTPIGAKPRFFALYICQRRQNRTTRFLNSWWQ